MPPQGRPSPPARPSRVGGGRRRVAVAAGLCLGLVCAAPAPAITLKAAYDQAGPANGYDRYVELSAGVTYTGGLMIGPLFSPLTWELEGAPGEDVAIIGHGAVLDLQGEQLCVSYCNNRLDIEDCVILHGNVRFRGMNTAHHVVLPTGSVRHVTFHEPHDYGIRLQGAGEGVLLERNLVIDALDTGVDFIYTHGSPMDWLPTGTNISASVQVGFYGTPTIRENWSFHSDPARNAEPLAHFSFLCEYG